jgi:hypothetical protein
VNDETYIGVDVHQATIVVAVMDSSGKLQLLTFSLGERWHHTTLRNTRTWWLELRGYTKDVSADRRGEATRVPAYSAHHCRPRTFHRC